MEEASKTLKKLSFELGGKNPNIIFADLILMKLLKQQLNQALQTKVKYVSAVKISLLNVQSMMNSLKN